MASDRLLELSDTLMAKVVDGAELLACLTCGGVVLAAGVQFHNDWHRNIAAAAILSERRLDRLEVPDAARQ